MGRIKKALDRFVEESYEALDRQNDARILRDERDRKSIERELRDAPEREN